MQEEYPQFKRIVEVVSKLRDPIDGCPWDLKQTHQSLTKYLIEESYEFVKASEDNDSQKMCEELGDVLLQVVLHSQIAKESQSFDIEKVAKSIADKMIHRHPHVFDENAKKITSDEVKTNWEKLKKKEDEFFFKKEDAYLPSLMASQKIGQRSKRVNFDWDNVQQVFEKVTEEYHEVKEEFDKETHDLPRIKEEKGDLLFSIVQFARHLDFDAEEVLRESNLKFIKRFNHMEKKAKDKDIDFMNLDISGLEELWQETKKELKKASSK